MNVNLEKDIRQNAERFKEQMFTFPISYILFRYFERKGCPDMDSMYKKLKENSKT